MEGTAHPADIDLTCPRCGSDVKERFYGPCASCRGELQSKIVGEISDIEATEYEPKMNVVPNAIASKE